MNFGSISSTSLLLAFIVYNVAFLVFVLAQVGKKWKGREPQSHERAWGRAGFGLAVVGFLCQLVYFFTRWAEGGHIPTSNMYEFMTFLSMMVIAAFLIIHLIYKTSVLGMFAMPVGIIIIAYAAVFPSEVQPLIPALSSVWLKIHVTTAALGEAFFAVGFAGGLMYLLRTVDYRSGEPSDRKERRGVEVTLFVIVTLVAFVSSIFIFNSAGYRAEFAQQSIVTDKSGAEQTVTQKVEYVLPPIFAPANAETVTMTPFLGMSKPLLTAPSWMEGVNAGRKLNTVVWSLIGGALLYGLLRLIARKPLGAVVSPLLQSLDPEDLDEIGYRAIAIGYPIFTLGALIFAMIWAQEAWGRFWGWDPKEVWALVTWLFYAAYLHLRLGRGWLGKKSAWLSVIGFIIVMFTLVGVNLIIAGLHSYSGV
ncbi:cytochrome c biogenesis protein CcsA [Paenibacillus chartarius]|uniref:Cytochrome c biogenesis protein CcsA n=1 Tax=Paenibacillus chartarius TaxID=747481 RepID=A0ABV6DQI4_9BACL